MPRCVVATPFFFIPLPPNPRFPRLPFGPFIFPTLVTSSFSCSDTVVIAFILDDSCRLRPLRAWLVFALESYHIVNSTVLGGFITQYDLHLNNIIGNFTDLSRECIFRVTLDRSLVLGRN